MSSSAVDNTFINVFFFSIFGSMIICLVCVNCIRTINRPLEVEAAIIEQQPDLEVNLL